MKKISLLAFAILPVMVISCDRGNKPISISGDSVIYGLDAAEGKTYTYKVNHALAGETFTWSSSDESVATIDKDSGVLTPANYGNVVITATSTKSSDRKAVKNVTIVSRLDEITLDKFAETYVDRVDTIESGKYKNVSVNSDDYAYIFDEKGESIIDVAPLKDTKIRYDALLYSFTYRYVVEFRYSSGSSITPYQVFAGFKGRDKTAEINRVKEYFNNREITEQVTFKYYLDNQKNKLVVYGYENTISQDLIYLHSYNNEGYIDQLLDYQHSGGVKSAMISAHFEYSK